MKNMLQNPYVTTTMLRDYNMFFGHQILLRRIYAELVSKQCISLIGLRHIGKSSLLRVLPLHEFQGDFAPRLQKHIFVPLDLREYRQKSGDDFFEAVSKHIVAKAHGHLELHHEPGEGGADAFSALLTEIQEQGFHTVLLMDAFDNVARNHRFDLDFFSYLRSQALRVSYVTATIAPLQKVCHSSVEDSPFFNIFAVHEVGPLDLDEARELILLPSEKAGLPFTSEEVDWVIKLAGRHPFFIQQVCNFFFEEKCLHDSSEVNRKRIKNQAYRALEPHFNDFWNNFSPTEQEQLKHEARMATMPQRALPELSESSLFRLFVRDTFKMHLFHMTKEELEKVLDKIDDIRALGDSELRHMSTVSMRFQQNTLSAVERGMIVREVLNEAFERMHGNGLRRDAAPEWRLYNILYYRYFKLRLKNDQISARLQFSSTRQYFRERTKAIEALLNILFEMEAVNLGKEEDS